jgi:hypothetical protein
MLSPVDQNRRMALAMPDCSPNAARDPETVRVALIEAALAAYDDAGLSGLCAAGRWEAAIGAMRTLDLNVPGFGARRADLQTNDVPHRTDTTRGG